MQQKTAPYDAVFVSAANWAFHLEDGIVKMGASALAFKKLLDQHVYCTQNNDFDGAQIFIQPGFKGRRIMAVSYTHLDVYKRQALHPEMFEISIEASEKGSLYHDAMESLVNTGTLDKWRNNLLVFEPPINPKTGCPYGRDTQKYQIALIEAKESNPGKTLTSTTDMQLVETMVYELLNNCRDTSKQIRQILKWGKAEVSHFVEYEGCKFKYRPDRCV